MYPNFFLPTTYDTEALLRESFNPCTIHPRVQPTFVTCMSKWSPIVHELHNSIMDFLTHMEPHQEVHVTFLGFTKLTLT